MISQINISNLVKVFSIGVMMNLMTARPLIAQDTLAVQVFPQGMPASQISAEKENAPALYIYPADERKNTQKAIILCPGGAYSGLAIAHEGHDIAQWLASEGITGIVLKYRVPRGNRNLPIGDARKAMYTVRRMAQKLQLNEHQIGLAGSSAGGHLASTIATHATDSLERPDFCVLFYPVISARKDCIHEFSFANLLGEKRQAKDYAEYSNELHVTPQTPPTLLLLSDDDTAVPPTNSLLYYNALKRNGVEAAMYIFPTGGHGWGYKETFPYKELWKSLLLEWLKKK